MDLDIRSPIGYFFTLTGMLLVAFGVKSGMSGSDIYAKHSLGVNVNLWWGMGILVFGLMMLALARAAKRARQSNGGTSQPPAGNNAKRGH